VDETVIEIAVEKPNPNFSLLPAVVCSDETTLFVTAEDPDLTRYIWNNVDGNHEHVIPGIDGPRHPLHINVEDSVIVNLQVFSSAGCKADTTIKFKKRLPEAYFIPSQRVGLNSLNLTFFD